MSDLKAEIDTGATRLQSMLPQLAVAASGQTAIPTSCYTMWQKRAELHVSLKATQDLLPMREHAWALVSSVLNDENVVDRTTNSVRFGGLVVPFATARHLTLAAYLTSTWSIYDRLSNISGRLVGHESIGNNPLATSNPKLIEHFMRENKERYKQHGFSLACLLPPAYGWPASVSYTIRNWLIHEGLEVDGVALFRGNTLSDAFEFSDPAITRIEERCKANGIQHSQCCLSADPDHPWYDKTILTVLEKCHSEVDRMFCSLLGWSVDSLARQVETFALRDTNPMAMITTTSPTARTT